MRRRFKLVMRRRFTRSCSSRELCQNVHLRCGSPRPIPHHLHHPTLPWQVDTWSASKQADVPHALQLICLGSNLCCLLRNFRDLFAEGGRSLLWCRILFIHLGCDFVNGSVTGLHLGLETYREDKLVQAMERNACHTLLQGCVGRNSSRKATGRQELCAGQGSSRRAQGRVTREEAGQQLDWATNLTLALALALDDHLFHSLHLGPQGRHGVRKFATRWRVVVAGGWGLGVGANCAGDAVV